MALACHGMALAWHGTICHGCSTSFTQLSTVRTHPPLALLQGTADAVRQYAWLFRDIKNRNVEDIVILSGDHLYRMDYMKARHCTAV